MSFKFKLEALRQYRTFQEDILQKELAQCQRDRDQEIELLGLMVDKRSRAEQDLKREQAKSTSGPHLVLYGSYLHRITAEIAIQRSRVKEAETVCRTKMAALLEAMQHRKTIDKLKENDLHAHIENLNQNEQKFLNEIAINQFTRNHS